MKTIYITEISGFIRDWVNGLDGEAVQNLLEEHFNIKSHYDGDGFFTMDTEDAKKIRIGG